MLIILAGIFPGALETRGQEVSASLRASYDAEAKGNFNGALEPVLAALNRNPRHYFCQMRAGYLYLILRQYPQGLTAYQAAAELMPSAVEPCVGALKAANALGNWTAAEKWGHLVLRKDPGNYTGLSRLAYSHYMRKDYALALTHYKEVLELYPSDIDMRNGLAWSCYYMGNKTEARKLFAEVLEVSPDNASANQGLAAAGK